MPPRDYYNFIIIYSYLAELPDCVIKGSKKGHLMDDGQSSTLPTGATTPEPQTTPSEAAPISPAPATTTPEPAKAPETTTTPTQEPQVPKGYVSERQFNRVQEALRKQRTELAKMRQGSQTQPEASQEVRSDPYVRDLELKVAENELKDGARRLLKQYPEIPKPVRQALLRNPRGFVSPTTQDVATGLLDIEDYLEEVREKLEPSGEAVTPQVPERKQVHIAGTNNQDSTKPNTTQADIDLIMKKPVSEWTKEDKAKLDQLGAPTL